MRQELEEKETSTNKTKQTNKNPEDTVAYYNCSERSKVKYTPCCVGILPLVDDLIFDLSDSRRHWHVDCVPFSRG